MIISDEGNKILESNGMVIKSKKTGEWEVVSGGGGSGVFALLEPTVSGGKVTSFACDKTYDEIVERYKDGPALIAMKVGNHFCIANVYLHNNGGEITSMQFTVFTALYGESAKRITFVWPKTGAYQVEMQTL